jgi:hypothetical protein
MVNSPPGIQAMPAGPESATLPGPVVAVRIAAGYTQEGPGGFTRCG